MAEKQEKEIQYLELKRKERENKPMTPEETSLLKAYRTREWIIQISAVVGFFTLVFLFVLMFDIFAEGTFWGLFTKKINHTTTDTQAFWSMLYDAGYLNILEKVFGDKTAVTVFGCIIFSLVHLAICAACVFLFAFIIRELIGVISRFVHRTKTMVSDVSKVTKESVETAPKIIEVEAPKKEKKTKKKKVEKTEVETPTPINELEQAEEDIKKKMEVYRKDIEETQKQIEQDAAQPKVQSLESMSDDELAAMLKK